MPYAQAAAAVWVLAAGSACGVSTAEDTSSPAPPTSPEPLLQWLEEGGYSNWHSRVTAGSSVEQGPSQVFLSPSLAQSLREGGGPHPVGAAAVRVFAGDDPGSVVGYGAAIKAVDEGGGGDDWYWYEAFERGRGITTLVSARGAPGCVGCHLAGRDFVHTAEAEGTGK